MKYIKLFEEFDNSSFDTIKIILKKVGVETDTIKFLSNGSNGFALDIGGDKVLKVTNHKQEAETAAWSIEYDFRWIVKVYDVFKVKSDKPFPKRLPIRLPYWEDVYFIIEEKLQTQPVMTQVANFLSIFVSCFNHDKIRKTGILFYLDKYKVKKYFNSNEVDLQIRETYKEVYELLYNLQTHYGLKYLDFQSGNVGRDEKGVLKIFDVYFYRKKGNIKEINI